MKSIHTPLNSPFKRAGLLVLILGVVLSLIGVIEITGDNYRFGEGFDDWFEAVLMSRNEYRRYPLAAWGVYLTVTGLLCSYLYDRTLGRLINWVCNG